MGKISVKERIAYALGGIPSGVLYVLVTSFLTYFYTNVIGVPVGSVGVVILVSRFFDGISDLIAGSIIDRTRSPEGKVRIWMRRMLIPYGLCGLALFFVPALAPLTVKLVYIFITYNLALTVVYTMLDISYNALISRMTQDQGERSTLAVVRTIFGAVLQLGITSLTLPIVRIFGDDQRAWIIVAAIYIALAICMLWLSYRNVRERVESAPVGQTSGEWKQGLKALLHNPYWAIILGVWTLSSVYTTILGIDQVYYCQYVFHNKELTGVLSIAQMVPLLLVVAFAVNPLVKKFGNRNVTLGGAVFAFVGQAIMILSPENFTVAIVSSVLKGIGLAPGTGVLFAMLNDTVEYGEWKYHVRTEGLSNSGASLGSKIGTGLASVFATGLLQSAGFDGMVEVQSASAMSCITGLYIYAPMIAFLLMTALMAFYKLDKLYPTIIKELEQRRQDGIQ